ncbi:hypothetical protein IE53DRAFT_385043 [Violaceomyces palustris]|uniref:Uncharacterized protein n=1 Tax=Violaceomyces palustris TaxID=1673888 RepID=A0ACD0P372_9BASI|nr:hypothetical protein IE53DRAFT_385043 [Violaceomyces palustris]
MPFGLKKKKSSKKLDRDSSVRGKSLSDRSPSSPQVPTFSDSERHDLNGGVSKAFKYAPSLSKVRIDLAGLPINVFGLKELTPVPARASAPPPPEVCAIIHMHGRCGDADGEEKIVRQLWDKVERLKMQAGGQDQRDCIIVNFDARNHGHRMTNKDGQLAWKQGNTRHALDLYGMITGTARDVSFIVDFLAPYLFPHDERNISAFAVTGKSLGGHSVWHVLAEEPRITVGVPFIGMPDYSKLLQDRTRTSFVSNGPPTVPASLKNLISSIDPAMKQFDVFDPSKNPFWGKKVCVCSGREDRLVKWDWNQGFLNALVLGEPNSRGGMDGLRVVLVDNVGHEVTEHMVEEAGDWIWRWSICI